MTSRHFSLHFSFSRVRPLCAALTGLAALPLALTGCGSGSGKTALPNGQATVPLSTYTVQDLGRVEQNATSATDMNDDGLITGYYSVVTSPLSEEPPPLFPFFYANGAFQKLDALVYPGGGQAVNDAGKIAGIVNRNDSLSAAVYENGQVRLLAPVAGSTLVVANAINNADQVVGYVTKKGESVTHAVLWANGGVRDLGSLSTGSMANDINDAGQIVGTSFTSNAAQAFLYENGAMRALETLPGTYNSYANAINNRKQIVGSVSLQNEQGEFAFVWENGVMQKLGTLGGQYTRATAINEAGQIVGSSTVSSGIYHAVLWQNGATVDLHAYLPYTDATSYAAAINDRGQILVNVQQFTGVSPSIMRRVILLTPKRSLAP